MGFGEGTSGFSYPKNSELPPSNFQGIPCLPPGTPVSISVVLVKITLHMNQLIWDLKKESTVLYAPTSPKSR